MHIEHFRVGDWETRRERSETYIFKDKSKAKWRGERELVNSHKETE